MVETHDYEADSIPNAFQAMVIENHNEVLLSGIIKESIK